MIDLIRYQNSGEQPSQKNLIILLQSLFKKLCSNLAILEYPYDFHNKLLLPE
jgi:hypothetical protein